MRWMAHVPQVDRRQDANVVQKPANYKQRLEPRTEWDAYVSRMPPMFCFPGWRARQGGLCDHAADLFYRDTMRRRLKGMQTVVLQRVTRGVLKSIAARFGSCTVTGS